MFPLARQHNWLIYSVVNPIIKRKLAEYARGRLVDIGCGEKPYEDLVKPYIDEHVGVDFELGIHDKKAVDLFGTAYSIPVPSESFDTAICTYVLEHLEEPRDALLEAYRVLKRGGYAVYTVPLYWHLHEEPRDFYRYTRYGLQYLFEKSGFQVIEIMPMTGFSVTFAQELVYFIYRYRGSHKWSPLWWLVPAFGHVVQTLGYLMSKIETAEDFTCEYVVVARKP